MKRGARRPARARRELTLRITYGTVKSFKPESKEPADWPFTTASQILAKDTGKEPFDAPAKLLEAIKAKKFGPYADPTLGGELPVDFLTDLDITGGNSGSPTLNDKGELVGLAFDGTTEGLASDVVFNGDDHAHDPRRRALHAVDRWTLLDGADHLIKEMGLTRRCSRRRRRSVRTAGPPGTAASRSSAQACSRSRASPT